MDRKFYEQMADGFAAQLKDIVSSSTYDQVDEMLDIIEQMVMNTESDVPAEKLKSLILDIYSARVDDIFIDEEISLEGLNLSFRETKTDDDDEDVEMESLSMDDFVFSI